MNLRLKNYLSIYKIETFLELKADQYQGIRCPGCDEEMIPKKYYKKSKNSLYYRISTYCANCGYEEVREESTIKIKEDLYKI